MISLWENWALLTWKVIGGMFWSFSGSEGHPRTPESSQLTTYCNIRSQDQISYNGTISLWENCVLLVWKVERGMSDDLRHVLAVFWLWGAPPRVPNVSQLTTQCAMKSRVMGGFHYRITGCCLHQRWKKEYLRNLRHVLAVFWLLGASKGPWRSPMVPIGQPSVPWEVKIKCFTTYGMISLWGKLSMEYMIVWGMFQ